MNRNLSRALSFNYQMWQPDSANVLRSPTPRATAKRRLTLITGPKRRVAPKTSQNATAEEEEATPQDVAADPISNAEVEVEVGSLLPSYPVSWTSRANGGTTEKGSDLEEIGFVTQSSG